MLLSYTDFFNIQESANSQPHVKYEYGCVMLMLNVTQPEWYNIIPHIEENDIYDNESGEFGIETEPHITLLFGLNPSKVSATQINEVINEFIFPSIYL
jgi:hypothetical protein